MLFDSLWPCSGVHKLTQSYLPLILTGLSRPAEAFAFADSQQSCLEDFSFSFHKSKNVEVVFLCSPARSFFAC